MENTNDILEEASREQDAILKFRKQSTNSTGFNMCACMGPRFNEPKCYCKMRMLFPVDGVYYRVHRDENGMISASRTEIPVSPDTERLKIEANEEFLRKLDVLRQTILTGTDSRIT